MGDILRGEESIKEIKGIGDKTAQPFYKLNIYSVDDLLHYYPRDYELFEETVLIKDAAVGETVSISASVIKILSVKKVRNLIILTVLAGDESNNIKLIFFNMPYLQSKLFPGAGYIFRGKLIEKKDGLAIEQPKMFSESDYRKLLGCMQPKYALTSGLTNALITKSMRYILSYYQWGADFLPEYLINEAGLINREQALNHIHFPDNTETFIQARKRLVFEEFFIFLLGIRQLKENNIRLRNHYQMIETHHTEDVLTNLPYHLTNAQKNVWNEIKKDLTGEYVMNRLIQGDVGSGKTILAFLSLIMCAANGFQGAMMAPTEVLARQHYEALIELNERYHTSAEPVLLTGSMKAKAKREAYEKIESGQANVILGTHALIQEKVVYHKLALVITDEQHRFGVRQREVLAQKGKDVHVLVMSATPIPRTLAIILYGDMNLSVLDEMPSNRLPIKNCVIERTQREKAYSFIVKQIRLGRQAYIICPMIEESLSTSEGMGNLENVTDYINDIKNHLPEDIRISSLHGKMSAAEKNKIMEEFSAHSIDILISTTVIEVGINVPNASVIMIENAERFGLAQLHQLRGRVGRGSEQSYCIFINGSGRKQTIERLDILNKSNDGFFIAEEDMKLRGVGDLFGIRQSGILEFKIGDIYQDASVLKMASEAVDKFLEKDEETDYKDHEELKKYLETEKIKFIDFRTI